MIGVKLENWKPSEYAGIAIIYLILMLNTYLFQDSPVAVFSAFFGITYTMLAGKGNPKCYLFGLAGSVLYSWLALKNALWGNLCLYFMYYIPMQIIGFFKWNQHLKADKDEIIKSSLSKKERVIISVLTLIFSLICITVLYFTGDKSPVMDGITTILSVTGMYLTVRRALEQWLVWIVVNGITALMWINIVLSGEKVYSTVVMWIAYFILALYFYREWKREVV